MAFVFEEKRHILDHAKQMNSVGPGYYENSAIDIKKVFYVNNNYKNTSQFMPKQNINKRRNKSMDQKEKSMTSPGPGHYQIKGEFEQKTQNEFINYMSQNNNSYQFISNSKKTQDLIQNKEVPGPGSYELSVNISKNINRRKSKNIPQGLKIIQEIIKKQENVPSIPFTQKQNEFLGYEIDNNNNIKKLFKEKSEDQGLGPGSYQIKQNELMFEKKKGVQFSSLKAERKMHESKDDKLGPGQYSVESTETSVFKMKSNSVFSSKTGRFEHQNAKDKQQKKIDLLYKVAKLQNIDFIKQRVDLNKLSENNYEELVDKVEELVEFIEDTIPGPGYYDVKREFENVKPKGINIKHNHRDFKKFELKNMNNIQVGPGSYNPQKIEKKNFNLGQVGFQSTEIRKEQIQDNPGPGKYDVKGLSIKDNVINNILKSKLNTQFGYNEKRFDNKQKVKMELEKQHLGPGMYEVEKKKKKRIYDDSEMSYYFKSQIPKANGVLVQNKSNIEQPCVGQYNLNYFDIKTEQDKATIKQLIKQNKVPFFSNQNRFDPISSISKVDQEYKDQLIDDQIIKNNLIEKQHQIMKNRVDKNKCRSFLSNQPRFNYSIHEDQDQTPPPVIQSNWIKDTYNVKFKKFNLN